MSTWGKYVSSPVVSCRSCGAQDYLNHQTGGLCQSCWKKQDVRRKEAAAKVAKRKRRMRRKRKAEEDARVNAAYERGRADGKAAHDAKGGG